MTIELSKKQFKKIASELHLFQKENPQATLGQVQQKLSQILYSKPYEEVEKTILTGLKTLRIFSCYNLIYFFRGERFVGSLPSKSTEKEMIKYARKNKLKCDNIEIISIPEIDYSEGDLEESDYILDDYGCLKSYTYKYVYKLAKKFGYFSERSFVLDAENCKHFKLRAFASNGEEYLNEYSNEHPCGDWEGNLTEDGFDALFMIIEINNQEGLYEYYLSVNDVEYAKYNETEKAWYIPHNTATLRFEFIN